MQRFKRLFLVIAFLALLLAVFHFSGLRNNFSLAFLHQQFIENEFTGLLIFVVLFAMGNLIQIPGWIFLAAAVLALGKSWGGLATYIAAVTSCVFTFGVIRSLGGDALRQINNKYAVRILSTLDRLPGTWALCQIGLYAVPCGGGICQLRTWALLGHRCS